MTLHHLSAEEIAAYLDGQCADSEYRHASNHLAACAECRLVADDQQFIKTIMGSLAEPNLPRSFMLPADTATVAPLTSPASPQTSRPAGGSITRFEPVARFLSIAAVIALLVLGGAQIAGVGESDNQDLNNIALSETETSDSALNEQEPALARGEVREQGESAAIGAGPLNATTALVDTPAQATDNGLTPFEITTIGVGIVALASIASWILIHYRAGEPAN